MTNEEYDSSEKQTAWEYFWEGYKTGKQIESYSAVAKRSARTNFEQKWKRNH